MVLLTHLDAGSLTDSTRFQYHGYFFKNEAMSDIAELKEIREFDNMLVFSMVRFNNITTEMIGHIMDGQMEIFSRMKKEMLHLYYETMKEGGDWFTQK